MEKHKKELEDFRTFQEKKKQEFIKRKAMCSDCKHVLSLCAKIPLSISLSSFSRYEAIRYKVVPVERDH